MEATVDRIIEALGTLEGPMQDLWGIALRANYASACIYLAIVAVLVVFQVFLWRYKFGDNVDSYDRELITVLLWLGRLVIGIVTMLYLSFAIYRLVAPEMATLKDILGSVGGAI